MPLATKVARVHGAHGANLLDVRDLLMELADTLEVLDLSGLDAAIVPKVDKPAQSGGWGGPPQAAQSDPWATQAPPQSGGWQGTNNGSDLPPF